MTDTTKALRKINMNLLPILAELLRCTNVTRAAGRLHLTQSTVSGSLKQLRELFDDELLVAHGRGMVLTQKAMKLVPEVERLMDLAARLFHPDGFTPETAENHFRIATADYVSALVTIKLSKTLQFEAPGVSLTLLPTPGTSAKEMRSGGLDLIICPNRTANWHACGISSDDPEFDHEVLVRDELVAIQSASHESSGRDLSFDEYLARPHVMYCRTDGQDTIEQEALTRLGVRQRSQFLVPYFTLLPQMVVDTDLVALVPRSLATSYSRFLPISIFTPPIEFPPLDLAMIWASSRGKDADQLWLRQMVRLVASSLQ
ncbi:LysR family transcriptional regulator [Lacisediminimonas profundi]|uniref:LysR family transcriptional regulator n=1 Tax=Lacisediminimonas profundi TaxID=2603856 RepID=UPI001386A34D|nr:LysR family transcriptional regulator [Lacisediminimonas profundi]